MATEQSIVTFKDIPGFPGYRAGDDGGILSAWVNCRWGRRLRERWKSIKPCPGSRGYLRVNLTPLDSKRPRTFRVHRLILEAFVGPCPEGMECRHLNGDKADNRLANLSWGTRQENMDDKRKHANHGPRARLYAHGGRTMLLKEWSRATGIPYSCLWHRVSKLGLTFEEAIARPYKGTASNGFHWTALKRSTTKPPEGP